jgi:hypothetical protein
MSSRYSDGQESMKRPRLRLEQQEAKNTVVGRKVKKVVYAGHQGHHWIVNCQVNMKGSICGVPCAARLRVRPTGNFHVSHEGVNVRILG